MRKSLNLFLASTSLFKVLKESFSFLLTNKMTIFNFQNLLTNNHEFKLLQL